MSTSTTPRAETAPAASSTNVSVPSNKGTIPERNDLEKCPVSHSKFPFQSITLSTPDWRKRMAKRTDTKA